MNIKYHSSNRTQHWCLSLYIIYMSEINIFYIHLALAAFTVAVHVMEAKYIEWPLRRRGLRMSSTFDVSVWVTVITTAMLLTIHWYASILHLLYALPITLCAFAIMDGLAKLQ